MQVLIDSIVVNYDVSGAGTKNVLVLHGWGDDMRSSAGISDALSKKYTVIRLDLPGFGKTDMPRGDWDLTSYAKFLHIFINKIKKNNLHAVIGHSNGGAIAIRAISLGLIKTDKLVLLASSGIREQKKVKKSLYSLIAKTGKISTFWLPKPQKDHLKRKLYNNIGSDLLVAPQLKNTFKKIVKDDIKKDALKISVATLLIYGDNDKSTPPEYGKKLNKLITKSNLIIVPDCGHFVHLENPEFINKKILEFLGVSI
jgi:pimeloyl-ACP methyl ester carboxylesterase